MKKSFSRITFFMIALFFISGWFNSSKAQWYMGGKAGITSFKIKGGDTYGGINNKIGVNVGMIFGLNFVTDFSLQAEILYSQKGFKQKFTEIIKSTDQDPLTGAPIEYDTTTKYSNSLSLSYIEIPILIKKSFSFRGGIMPYNKEYSIIDLDLFIGPYFGYLISASATLSSLQSSVMKVNDTVQSSTNETEQAAAHSFRIGQKQNFSYEDDSDAVLYPPSSFPTLYSNGTVSKGLNPIDVGLIFGGGLSIELSSHVKMFIDARYSMGLMTIDKTYFNNVNYNVDILGGLTTTPVKLDLKNIGMAINIGIIKYLGK